MKGTILFGEMFHKFLKIQDREGEDRAVGPAALAGTLLALLIAAALALRPLVVPWLQMWILAAAVYAGCKGLTLSRPTIRTPLPHPAQVLAYLLLWPGMNPERFFGTSREVSRPSARAWLAAWSKALFGAGLLWGVARLPRTEILGGWIGMVGMICLLHFGIFQVAALAWQLRGVDAPPLMRKPCAAASLSEFWSSRWNTAFRDLAHRFVFVPVRGRYGVRGATLASFAASGLAHDLVISVPAGGGYGLPTAYFLLQGIGVLIERRFTPLRRGWGGRLFAFILLLAPLPLLFHRPFAERVIVPFLHAIHALPS